jgi:pimeloyl-ACP methyl ester carboxylesterase
LVAVAVTAAGCSALPLLSYTAVREAQPADHFLRVGNQWVYVEQAGKGEAVVLLHGFGASSYSWRKVLPDLAQRFHVVAIDLNGFGYTERLADPSAYTREGQERLILGVLDVLHIDRAHFVGHSYGGGLAQFVVSRHLERVRSLVLVDSSAATYPDDRRSRLALIRPFNNFVLSRALRVEFIRKSLAHSFADESLATPELAQAYLDRVQIEGERAAYYGLTARLGPKGPPVNLADLRVPTLIVWGARDRIIPASDGEKAAARIPDARFVLLEGCGHLPMEEKPEDLLRVVLPFLEGHSKPSA